jgi:hypothetical protein
VPVDQPFSCRNAKIDPTPLCPEMDTNKIAFTQNANGKVPH